MTTQNSSVFLAGAARKIGFLSLITSPLMAVPTSAAAQDGFIELRTGVKLHYVEAGRVGAPAVVLLHGFLDSWQVYEELIPALAGTHHVLALDQRGHGDSEKPACCYEQRDFVEDVLALLDAKGIGRATVVGHSLGSFIATNLAADHPGRVDRLVLVGSGRWCDPVQCAEVRGMALATPDEPDPEQVRAFQRSSFFAEPDPAVFAAIMAQSLKVPGRVWRQALVSAIDDDRRQQLPRIRARTLVLAGKQDGFFPEVEQRNLYALLRDARLILYDDTGHFPQFERPVRFVEDIVAFIREPAVHARTGT